MRGASAGPFHARRQSGKEDQISACSPCRDCLSAFREVNLHLLAGNLPHNLSSSRRVDKTEQQALHTGLAAAKVLNRTSVESEPAIWLNATL